MMATVSDFALLTSVLPILIEIVERLTGDSELAKAAQDAINKDSPLDDSFHVTIYTRLDTIESSLWGWSESKYLKSAAVQAPVQNLLGIFEELVAGVFQHQQSAYPGLTQIKDIADSPAALSSDTETEIVSRLFCPKPEAYARLVTAASDCAETFDKSSLTSSIRDIAQSQELLPPIERICDGAMNIEAAIKQGLNCISCGCQHEAVFSFATPCHGKETYGNCLTRRPSLVINSREATSLTLTVYAELWVTALGLLDSCTSFRVYDYMHSLCEFPICCLTCVSFFCHCSLPSITFSSLLLRIRKNLSLFVSTHARSVSGGATLQCRA
jgi:hypothetical protein